MLLYRPALFTIISVPRRQNSSQSSLPSSVTSTGGCLLHTLGRLLGITCCCGWCCSSGLQASPAVVTRCSVEKSVAVTLLLLWFVLTGEGRKERVGVHVACKSATAALLPSSVCIASSSSHSCQGIEAETNTSCRAVAHQEATHSPNYFCLHVAGWSCCLHNREML